MEAVEPIENASRRQFYDSTAGLYRATFHLIWRLGFRYLHTWLSEELREARLVLDAGAATGYWSRVLSRDPGKHVVAMDFSAPYVAMAQRYLRSYPQVGLIQGDITASPFHDRSFDAILCSGVLDTIPDPADALAEFRRILRDHGKLLLIIRGQKEATSSATERIIRGALSTFRLITGRGTQSSMSGQVWRRSPVWPQLPEIAEQAGFRIARANHGRLATNVVLNAV